MNLDPHWRETLAACQVASPPPVQQLLPENDLHPDPARLASVIRQLEIRVNMLEFDLRRVRIRLRETTGDEEFFDD